MNSITTAKLKLPIDFIENLYKQYNEKTANRVLAGMLEKRFTTLRVNTLKSNNNHIEQIFDNLGIEFEKVDFYNDAYVIKNQSEKDLEKEDFYKDGLVYIQSLSSMLPPLILNPKAGDRVLDLTSAPGSKTTQMACMMENRGYILANELDKYRCEKLKYNIDMQGVQIAEISNCDGRSIGDKFEESFDKVLLDVPCSGEGRFLVDFPKSYSNWSLKIVNDLSNLQRELFTSGYKALKNGGTMVYSTCTLNVEENEKVIDWALKNFDLQILDIDINVKETLKPTIKNYSKDIAKTMKILPSKKMEGFFVCLLQKML